MNYESTITKESAHCARVRYTFRRMSEGMRIALRQQLSAAFGRLRDLAQDRDALHVAITERLGKPIEQVLVGELTPEERARMTQIEDEQGTVQECTVQPAYFAAAFVRVAGLTIDGLEPDGTVLRECGPPELVQEITAAILEASTLTAAERENFGSPTTSGAQVAGPTSDTSARAASDSGSTSSGSAASTSQAQP